MKNFQDRGVSIWIQYFCSGSGPGFKISLDPDPISPERLDPVNIRPDPKPLGGLILTRTIQRLSPPASRTATTHPFPTPTGTPAPLPHLEAEGRQGGGGRGENRSLSNFNQPLGLKG